jgi:PAS domain S-box-containing protein
MKWHSTKNTHQEWYERLRRMADQKVQHRSGHVENIDSADLSRLIDEIQIFQVELELQNEEMRHSLEELEKSRTRFSRLFDMAPAGYVVLDESGMILQVNQTLVTMLKKRPDALMGKPFSRFVSSEDQNVFLSRFAAFYKHPENKTLEVRLVSDRRFVCHARLQGGFIPFETVPGKPDIDRFCLIVTDITESKAAEIELKRHARNLNERNKELNCLFSISRLIGDPELNVDDIMTGAIRFLTKAFQFPDKVCGAITLSENTYASSPFQPSEHHLSQDILVKNRKLGSIDIYSAPDTPLTDGAPFLEEEKALIESVALRLGHAVERIQAEKRILYLQKTESLGRMAGAMAHHYNNLLTSVMGNLEMAMEDLPDHSPIAGNLEQAMQAAERISKLGGTMLAYLGQTHTPRRRLDLSKTCRTVVSEIQADIPSWIELKTDIPIPGPAVQANAGEIAQILKSLITNAREAMEDRPGVIDLSICRRHSEEIPSGHRHPLDFHPDGTDFACIRVHDSGSGIPENHMEKIFDPFFSTRFTGRGLGLPIVLGIVKSLSGCITVSSSPGSGTAFQVFIPVLKHESSTEDRSPSNFI